MGVDSGFEKECANGAKEGSYREWLTGYRTIGLGMMKCRPG